MTTWQLHDGSRVRDIKEDDLRKRLRDSSLTGMEFVRRDGESTWIPLHRLPLFREEVPSSLSPEATARWQLLAGWLPHLLVYLIVNFGGEFHWAVALGWGMGLLAHTLKVVPAFFKPAALPPAGEGSTSQLPAGTVTPLEAPVLAPPTAEPAVSDPFTQELEDALAALHRARQHGERTTGHGLDLDGIRRTAAEMHRRRVSLEALASPQARARLEAERGEVEGRVSSAADALTREAYARQAQAIVERLTAIDAAGAAADRIRARERTLLHQLESLRLAALRADLDGPDAPDLTDRVRTLQGELDAATEVEESLARARVASQQRVG